MAHQSPAGLQDDFRASRRPSYVHCCSAILALIGAAAVLLDLAQWDHTLASSSYNILSRIVPATTIPEVIIIDMDEASHERLGQPRFGPWDRRLHGNLLGKLSAARTGPVVFDLVFVDPQPGDAELAAAIAGYPTNVFLAGLLDPVLPGPGELRFRPVLPTARLLTNAWRAGNAAPPFGFSEFTAEPDGVVREFWPVESGTGGDLIPRLAFAAYQTAQPVEASRVLLDFLRTRRNLGLRYYGPPLKPFRHIPYHEILSTNSVSFLEGRFILVGSRPIIGFTGTRKDTFLHPSAPNVYLPGIELHATILANLIRGEWLIRPHALLELAGAMLIGVLLGRWLCGRTPARAWLGCALCLGLTLGFTAVAWTAFRLWFPWLTVAAVQIPAAGLLALAGNAFRSRIELERLRHSFGVYASERLATAVARNPALLAPGSERREVTLLFSDIVSFTRIGERMDPQDYQRLLQRYYEIVLECVFEKQGTVLNIIGDCIFAAWNTPLSPHPEHARLACEAALLIQQRVSTWSHQQEGPRLLSRIGIHTGDAHIGNFGTPHRMVYTAIGEPVNLASRLEGLNKYLGTRTLTSRTTQKHVESTMPARRVGMFRFQGFDRPVEVFELLGEPSGASGDSPWLDAFATGLRLFRRRDFEGARKAFETALALRPDDTVASYYLADILPESAKLDPDGDDEEFGVITLPGK